MVNHSCENRQRNAAQVHGLKILGCNPCLGIVQSAHLEALTDQLFPSREGAGENGSQSFPMRWHENF